MTVQTVAGTPGSSGRPHHSAPIAGGPRTQQSTVTDVMQQAVMYAVPQALTDDDSAGQG